MFQTNQKAQSGLEYLMTYGWALVLIAAVLGVLVFIVSSPASDVTFSSSNPTKIMIKAGASDGSTATVQMQNITGGDIEVISINSGEFSNCTLNDQAAPVSIAAGGQMLLECDAPSDNTGTITIDYTDFAGLNRTADITAIGGSSISSPEPQLFENHTTGDTGEGCVSTPDNFMGQTFTPSQAHTLTSVKLKLYRTGSPGQAIVEITATDGSGLPTGPGLCSGTIDGDTLTADFLGEWREITMGAGCSLSASNKYAIVLKDPPSDMICWRRGANFYVGGNMVWTLDGGTTWNQASTLGTMFEEWGIPT